MNKWIFRIVICVASLLMLAAGGCSGNRYPHVLAEADRLTETDPGAALSLLNSIEGRMHKEQESTVAYWRLLRARSLKFRGRRGRSLGVDFVTCCKEHTEVCD